MVYAVHMPHNNMLAIDANSFFALLSKVSGLNRFKPIESEPAGSHFSNNDEPRPVFTSRKTDSYLMVASQKGDSALATVVTLACALMHFTAHFLLPLFNSFNALLQRIPSTKCYY